MNLNYRQIAYYWTYSVLSFTVLLCTRAAQSIVRMSRSLSAFVLVGPLNLFIVDEVIEVDEIDKVNISAAAEK